MKSTKRFGPRYGKRLKDRMQVIENDAKGKQKCPYCRKQKVKRIAAGIFVCGKCSKKFTGRAYTVVPPKVEVFTPDRVDEPVEAEEEYVEVEENG
jgi:large subunit ribosomal protein L37Ae